MKLGTLSDPRFRPALAKLQSAPLSLKVAFKVRSLAKAIEKELGVYEETRQAALNKYGKKNEDGSLATTGAQKNVQFEDGQFEKFIEELNELNNVDVVLEKLSASDLGENVRLSADDLAMLEDLFDV